MTPTFPWRFAAPVHPLVRLIPAFTDNYFWLLRSPQGRQAAVVDPGDSAPVLDALSQDGLQLTTILLTHHHADHAGGVADLIERTGAAVYGPAIEAIPGVSQAVAGGDRVDPGLGGANALTLAVPGHTRGHVAYLFDRLGDDPRPLLFCGDTLFAGGCGRVFEGTPAQMLQSLDSLAALAADTLVYCAHEYTHSNLRFAQAAEPDSVEVEQRLAECVQMRQDSWATVPSTIAIERASNPFLRVGEPGIVRSLTERLDRPPRDRVDAFTALREWKNVFK